MEMESCDVPPGFRFHPTEEELVGYYLARKVASEKIDLDVINEVDLYRIEPWDLLEKCKSGSEEQNAWYFFSHKDKKYPSGTRTNRATAAGFWKATGRDKAVVSKSKLIGLRKTLVFYKGRAPNGRKSDWIIHEYRLQSSEHGLPQDDGWVVCRAFRKPCPNQRKGFDTMDSNYYVRDHQHQCRLESFMDSSQLVNMRDSYAGLNFQDQPFSGSVEVEPKSNQLLSHVYEIPQLRSPTNLASTDGFEPKVAVMADCQRSKGDSMGQLVDWKSMDMLLSSEMCVSTQYNSSNTFMIHIEYEAETHNHEDQYLKHL